MKTCYRYLHKCIICSSFYCPLLPSQVFSSTWTTLKLNGNNDGLKEETLLFNYFNIYYVKSKHRQTLFIPLVVGCTESKNSCGVIYISCQAVRTICRNYIVLLNVLNKQCTRVVYKDTVFIFFAISQLHEYMQYKIFQMRQKKLISQKYSSVINLSFSGIVKCCASVFNFIINNHIVFV